jgi:hypothetical protein
MVHERQAKYNLMTQFGSDESTNCPSTIILIMIVKFQFDPVGQRQDGDAEGPLRNAPETGKARSGVQN